MHKNIDDAIASILRIEQSLPRRKPTLERWKNFHMAHEGQWYYAYTVGEDTVTVEDACHAQNMHE